MLILEILKVFADLVFVYLFQIIQIWQRKCIRTNAPFEFCNFVSVVSPKSRSYDLLTVLVLAIDVDGLKLLEFSSFRSVLPTAISFLYGLSSSFCFSNKVQYFSFCSSRAALAAILSSISSVIFAKARRFARKDAYKHRHNQMLYTMQYCLELSQLYLYFFF